MTAEEIEKRWKSISRKGVSTYRSLLLAADSIPQLFIGIDLHGNRYLILSVPGGLYLSPECTTLQNLSFEVQPEDRRIVTGLRNAAFKDLFNDLILSLYNRIRTMQDPAAYVSAFAESFRKWAEFFEDAGNTLLSRNDVQGLFGEILVLQHLLHQQQDAETTLAAWLGPYGRSQDFILPAYNLEVKTREAGQTYVRISSEHQLQPEAGKGLRLAVVTVQEHSDGFTLEQLARTVRSLLNSHGADVAVFQKALLRSGVSAGDCTIYDQYKWLPQTIDTYDCAASEFPSIIASALPKGVSTVRYQIATELLYPFLLQTHTY